MAGGIKLEAQDPNFAPEVERNAYELAKDFPELIRNRRKVQGVTYGRTISTSHGRSLNVKRAGNDFVLEAHFPDVAATIPVGSLVDQESRKRLKTAWPNGIEAPIYPLSLTQSSLNLKVGQLTPSVTYTIGLDSQGQIEEVKPEFTAFESLDDLDYHEADDALGQTKHPLHDQFKTQDELARILHEDQYQRGALVGYDLGTNLETSEVGRLRRIPPFHQYESFVIKKILEITVNETISEYLRQISVPAIYRVHQPVRDIYDLLDIAEDLNTALDNADPDTYNNKHGDNLGSAEYSIRPTQHFALALPRYIHIGNPLDSYVDSANQRIVMAASKHQSQPYTPDDLANIAAEVNQKRAALHSSESIQTHGYQITIPRRIAHVEPARGVKITEGDRRRAVLAGEVAENGAKNLTALFESASITAKDLMLLLLEESHGADQEIRATILSWLTRTPHAATMIVNTGTQYYGWEKPKYEVTKTTYKGRPVFRSSVQIMVDAQKEEHSSISVHALAANTAKHLAAVAVLSEMTGVPVDLTEVINTEINRMPVQGVKKPQNEHASRVPRERPIRRIAESYCDLYDMFCVARGWPEPIYTTEVLEPENIDGVDLPKRFKVSVTTTSRRGKGYTLYHYGISHESEEDAREKAAAYAVQNNNLYPADYAPLKPVKFPEGKYDVAINGLRLRASLPKPRFTHNVVNVNGVDIHHWQIRQVGPRGRLFFAEAKGEDIAESKNEATKKIYEALISPPNFKTED